MNKHSHLIMEENHMDRLYHDPNPLISHSHQKRLSEIVKSFSFKNSERILDAGCGEGHLLKLFKEKNSRLELYGADVTLVALAKAQERVPEAKFLFGDISEKLDYPDNFFDAVVITEVLEHIYHYPQALAELKRLVKPNGFLLITFPNEPLFIFLRFIFGRRPIKIPDHLNSFLPSSIIKLVDWPVVKKRGLPLPWPFFLSPNYLIMFQKTR
ncbi:MAG: class I SAM-dependent methyltransferase [Candidatus Komeilibacteria bacterium]|nr:class I SAM-dependent methyltransferase [Candidatus Komeilibacteria bacterium]